jgi:hypothetical protein
MITPQLPLLRAPSFERATFCPKDFTSLSISSTVRNTPRVAPEFALGSAPLEEFLSAILDPPQSPIASVLSADAFVNIDLTRVSMWI